MEKMHKKNLRQLLLMGISTGLLAQQGPLTAAEEASSSESMLDKMVNAQGGNLGYHLFSEEEMELELSPEGLSQYQSLSPEGKRLARIVASAKCDGQNKCEGLNACKTAKNDCAGKGSCQGQGKCAVPTKDMAVKLVAEKMAKKRADAVTPQKQEQKQTELKQEQKTSAQKS